MAVSGGVDSMVLLQMLALRSDLDLVVAHFEHGIRSDADEDRQFVGTAASRFGLPYIYEHGELGLAASEATARRARYDFLRRAREQHGARAIVTAHHEDDVVETAIINMLRGTGRKGLSSLRSGGEIIRPLLHISKKDIAAYAAAHGIAWREDSTNNDDRYLRNRIRHRVVPRLGPAERSRLLVHIATAAKLNDKLDSELAAFLQSQPAPDELARRSFAALPHAVAREVAAAWLRQNDVLDFNRNLIERLVVAGKTWPAGKQFDVNARLICRMHKNVLKLTPRSRS